MWYNCHSSVSVSTRTSSHSDVISLSVETQECGSGSAVLPCYASGVKHILFQVYEYDGHGFSTLSPSRISADPEYEEIEVNGVYKLRVVRIDNHNGSVYRCLGFFNGEIVYSNEVLLLQSCKCLSIWRVVVSKCILTFSQVQALHGML